MQLLNDLISAVKSGNIKVNNVRVGVSWTGVHGLYGGIL